MQKIDESPVIPQEYEPFRAEYYRLLLAIAYRLNRMVPQDGSEGLFPWTMATRPSGTNVMPGSIIYVSDGGAGNVFQGWNGAAWVSLG